MQRYHISRFFSSLDQVERRISSESPQRETLGKRKFSGPKEMSADSEKPSGVFPAEDNACPQKSNEAEPCSVFPPEDNECPLKSKEEEPGSVFPPEDNECPLKSKEEPFFVFSPQANACPPKSNKDPRCVFPPGYNQCPEKSNEEVPHETEVPGSCDEPLPSASNISNFDRNTCEGTESVLLSACSEFSFESQIMACRAKPFVYELHSLTNSEVPLEMLSLPDNADPAASNSSEVPKTGAFGDFDGFLLDADVDIGDFDDIVELCDALKLNKDRLRESPNNNRAIHGKRKQDATCCSVAAETIGPRTVSEVESMDAWIKYFLVNKKEPLRLVHLLLAKAFVENNGEELEFPDTVQQFLTRYPPSHEERPNL